MRILTDKEKSLLKLMVEYKRNGNLKDLQVAPLLRKNLSFIALRWCIDPIPSVDIYVFATNDNKYAIEQYFSVLNFIYFIQELADLGYVKLLTLPSQRADKQRELFDREKYEFDANKNQFIQIGVDKKNGILSLMKDFEYQLFGKSNEVEFVNPLVKQTLPNSFAFDLDKIVYSIIYPMPVAEEYVRNEFKTYEQQNIEKQLSDSRKSLCWARWTFIISFFALVVTIFISKWGSQKMDDTQFETIVDALESNTEKRNISKSITIPDTIKASTNILNKPVNK